MDSLKASKYDEILIPFFLMSVLFLSIIFTIHFRMEFEKNDLLDDEYEVNKPNSRVKIVSSPQLGEGLHYFVEEVELNEDQYDTYEKIVRILSREFTSPSGEKVDPIEYVYEQAEMIAEKYHKSLGKFTIEQWDSIFYYVVRDLAGYGALHAIMLDPNIEDISCNGLNSPIYVWHRKFESIPTNIRFTDEQMAGILR